MYSKDDLIAMIEEETRKVRSDVSSVTQMRHQALAHALAVVQKHGLPLDRHERLDVSLVPFLFQEALHDDIDWTHRTAPLRQLSGLFMIDIAVQMGGRARHELDDRDYEDYVNTSNAAIKHRTRKLPK